MNGWIIALIVFAVLGWTVAAYVIVRLYKGFRW